MHLPGKSNCLIGMLSTTALQLRNYALAGKSNCLSDIEKLHLTSFNTHPDFEMKYENK